MQPESSDWFEEEASPTQCLIGLTKARIGSFVIFFPPASTQRLLSKVAQNPRAEYLLHFLSLFNCMFTPASQLPQYVGNEQRLALPLSEQLVPDEQNSASRHHQSIARRRRSVAKDNFGSLTEPEERLTIGNRYQLLLPANDGGWIQGFDYYTNTNIHCHIHYTKRFLELSQLLSMKIDGVRYPYDIQGLGQEVAVIYTQTHGALHGYLKQRKSLSEVEAASFFRQIVLIINNAHKHGVALRDLKLKKFVFMNPERCVFVCVYSGSYCLLID